MDEDGNIGKPSHLTLGNVLGTLMHGFNASGDGPFVYVWPAADDPNGVMKRYRYVEGGEMRYDPIDFEAPASGDQSNIPDDLALDTEPLTIASSAVDKMALWLTVGRTNKHRIILTSDVSAR